MSAAASPRSSSFFAAACFVELKLHKFPLTRIIVKFVFTKERVENRERVPSLFAQMLSK